MIQTCPLVLASGSHIRKKLLHAAGLRFEVCKPKVDEQAITAANPQLSPTQLAVTLARAKALAETHDPQALVVGADQVLEVDDKSLCKVQNLEDARSRLWRLRGREHFLTGACVLARDGKIIWENNQRSKLTMRNFSQSALDAYMEQTGKSILASVGCYELEAEGLSLFENLEGDYFAMLGLAVLPLLQALRDHGGLQP